MPLGIGMKSLDPLSDITLVQWVQPNVVRVCRQFLKDEEVDTIGWFPHPGALWCPGPDLGGDPPGHHLEHAPTLSGMHTST